MHLPGGRGEKTVWPFDTYAFRKIDFFKLKKKSALLQEMLIIYIYRTDIIFTIILNSTMQITF